MSLVLGMALSASSSVQALFISVVGNVNVDGIVDNVNIGDSTLTITTAGTPAITFDINGKTNFAPDGLSFGDLEEGDHVRVNAKPVDGGNPLAIVVRKLNNGDPGYGTRGDNVTVNDAVVTGKTSNTFTVDVGYTEITFRVLSSTNFNGIVKNFSDLQIGNTVHVNGEDNTTEFIARQVIVTGGNAKNVTTELQR